MGNMRHRILFKGLIATLAVAFSACTVHEADPGPAPFGPSTFSLAIGLSANPDSISQDGTSQSSIVVTAFDENGGPKPGVVIRLDLSNGVDVTDVGTGRLSARTVVTGTDGRATAIYTAPPFNPFGGGPGTLVTIIATPSGTNAQGLNPQRD